MAAGYSNDLRERVVAAVQAGMSRRKAAELFRVSASVAIRWMQRVSETGSCHAKPTGGDMRSRGIEAHQAWLLLQIAEEPDLTLEEIRGRLAAEHSFKASVSMLWRFFRRHRVSFKKTLHAAEQDRPDVAAARQEWHEKQPTLEISRLVFIDETWASTSMTRLRGRSRIGQRLVGKTPHGHWKTTTFVAALRCDGVTAPFVIDKAMTGELFLAYVRQFLLPTLRKGDIVIMDNLPAHKVDGVAEAIESAEARGSVPAIIFPRFEPDRDAVRQTQSAAAKGQSPQYRQPLAMHRGTPRHRLYQGMSQLFQT